MRVRLKGIHRVKSKLADGSRAIYFYAWRGGPRLVQEPHSPAFIAEYAAAHASRKLPPSGLLFGVISQYRASAEFTHLAESTKKSYRNYLKQIEVDFGNMPVAALADKRVRGEFKAWRDKMAATPRTADLAWTVLARVMSFAKDRGIIDSNPCERGGRLHSGSRVDRVWSEEQLVQLTGKAEDYLKLAIVLAVWTGQRQGDLLKLRWSDYDGKKISFQQSKGGRYVVIPASKALKAVLDTTKRESPLILTNMSAKPWTSDGFRTSFRKLCKKAGVSGLTFHDFRGTAVTKLARAGATIQEIASITGHSFNDVSAILERHYLGDRATLAALGMKKLERKEARTKTVKRL